MAHDYDAVIIGSGIIGACTAFELAKRGKKTLNLDMLPAAGYGSTSNSCAIIRLHYSTSDGTALALENYHYWKDWGRYLGASDEKGTARFIECGCMVMKSDSNRDLETVKSILDTFHFPYEDWSPARIREAIPIYDLRKFHPPRRPEDPAFGRPTGDSITGAVYYPRAGYISDPQLSTHNVQRAAEHRGAAFRFNTRVVDIIEGQGRVRGVALADGTEIEAPVVVNCAGPHSFVVNRLAGVEDGMRITTRALRQEVAHVPSPARFDYEHRAPLVSDGDIGCYSRPEVGNHILIGSEDPECDPRESVDPDDYDKGFTDQWTAQVHRVAQRIPELGIPRKKQGVVDLYDVSDDWIPIYDASDLPGFYMAIGTSGNQYKNAPVVGAMMAELIEAVEQGRDHDTNPLRFHLKHMKRDLDLGFFLPPANNQRGKFVLGPRVTSSITDTATSIAGSLVAIRTLSR